MSEFSELFEPSVCQGWSEKIIDAVMANETLKRKVEITEAHAVDPTFGVIEGGISSVEALKSLQQEIEAESSAYDSSDSAALKKIKSILQVCRTNPNPLRT